VQGRAEPGLCTERSCLLTSFVNVSAVNDGGDCFITSLSKNKMDSVDEKNELDVTFCILYFSSNSCSTCFGQPCAHHQELTTA